MGERVRTLRAARLIWMATGIVMSLSAGLAFQAQAAKSDAMAPPPAPPAASSTTATQHYVGVAYAADDGRELYRESHWVLREGANETRLVLYQCPDGAPFARKWVRGASDDPAPDFDLIDQRDGYREGVRTQAGKREVYVRKGAAAPVQTADLPDDAGLVIDAGFDAYVRMHWAALRQGDAPVVPFVVPSRLAAYGLKVSGLAQAAEGAPGFGLRMRLDAWYGFAVPAIQVTYTDADRRLWRFEGVSNIRSANGDTQNVRLEFPAAERRAPPSRQDIDAAAALPLVGRCA